MDGRDMITLVTTTGAVILFIGYHTIYHICPICPIYHIGPIYHIFPITKRLSW